LVKLVVDPAIRDSILTLPHDARAAFRKGIYIFAGLVSLAALVICVMTAMGGIMPWAAKYYTDWFLVALLGAVGPLGFFYSRDLKKIESIDEKFPDFLRDLAESARAGMTLPRAMVSASRGSYGELTADIRQMAAQVEWGVDFTETLARYGKKTQSSLIKRVVSLIIEARHAGGNVVDVLTAASDDAREIRQIITMRNNQMQSYSIVIYITFFVFIAVVLILKGQFIPAFAAAVDAAGGGVQVGGLRFKQFDPEDFNTIFFHAAIIQALGGGLVGGVLTRGHAVAGMRSIVVMISIAWIAFRVTG